MAVGRINYQTAFAFDQEWITVELAASRFGTFATQSGNKTVIVQDRAEVENDPQREQPT